MRSAKPTAPKALLREPVSNGATIGGAARVIRNPMICDWDDRKRMPPFAQEPNCEFGPYDSLPKNHHQLAAN